MVIDRYYIVDLKKPLMLQNDSDMHVTGDKNAHCFHIQFVNNDEQVAVSGTVTAYFLRADGNTVLMSGSVTNGNIEVTLSENCYLVPGWSQLVVKLTKSGVVTTVFALNMRVMKGSGNTLIDPEHAVPTLDDLLAQIERMEQATAAAEEVAENVEGMISAAVDPVAEDVTQLKEEMVYVDEDYYTEVEFAEKSDFTQDTEALNAYNLIENLALEPRTAHGVTWSWSGHNLTAKSNGSASGTENYSVFSSTTSLPKGFIPGRTYRVRHSTTTFTTKVYDYSNGTTELFNSKKPGTFTIPNDCAGMIIRFSVGSGVSVDETAYICITDETVKTNSELTAEIASVYNEYWSGMNAVSGHITKTTNLIDPSTLTSGYILVNNVPTATANYYYSDYIKTGCVPICYRDQGASISSLVSCYDKDKNYLGAVAYYTDGYQRVIVSDGSHPTSYYMIQPINGTEYIRVNGRYTTALMLTLFFYPPYVLAYGESYVNDNGNRERLKVAMFGDSITYGTNGNTAERVSKPITDYVQELTGFEVTNYGVGSMGWVSTAYNPQIAYDKISSEDLTGFDVITLCYGVNDSAATMGTYDSTDETTIMGQVNKCVKYIGAQNPGARIIIIAPWNGAKYGSFPDWRYASRTSGGYTRAELSEELCKAAEHYYIGFISQKDSPLNGFGIGTVNDEKTGPYLGSDNVHPTPEGYKAIGEWLSAKIKGIIV